MKRTTRSTVKRVPKRGIYDQKEIHRLLDKQFLCHVGFVHQNTPVVIPTMFGRDQNTIYIHGASVSRLVTELEKGIPVSISVAEVNGLVLARSAFHHSLNYESVVLFGTGTLVEEERKTHALKCISDHLIPFRWEEARQPSPKELKATKVIQIPIDEASAKVRTGGPADDKSDYALPIWAGVIPLVHQLDQPIPDPLMENSLPVPRSVNSIIKNKKS